MGSGIIETNNDSMDEVVNVLILLFKENHYIKKVTLDWKEHPNDQTKNAWPVITLERI